MDRGQKKQKTGAKEVSFILRLGAESLPDGTICIDTSESKKNDSQVIQKVNVDYATIGMVAPIRAEMASLFQFVREFDRINLEEFDVYYVDTSVLARINVSEKASKKYRQPCHSITSMGGETVGAKPSKIAVEN
jgi:hypothetical protein